MQNRVDTPVYQDIRNDIVFKRFFGRRENKNLLITMLNLIIRDFSIVDLEYISPELTGFDRSNKNSRMDLRVKTDNGTEIDIEVQVEDQHDFKDRAVYYATLPMLQEIQSGDHNYHLTPRYVLAFLNFQLPHSNKTHWQTEIESRYEIMERYTLEKLSDAFNLIFVELRRFKKKSLGDIDNDKERFYFCLLHFHEFSEMPKELRGIDFFERLFKAAEFEAMNKDEKDQYIRFMTTERDLINQRIFAHDKGFEEGIAEGEARGRAEGRAEGEVNVAKALLASGMSADEISRITGLPKESFCR